MVDGNRIRVLIAGNVYAKRTLVRRILEDGGYEVVGDVIEPGDVLEAARVGRPDAVILDEDLVARGLSLDELRRAAPDVRIVVSTSVVAGRGAPPPGADGYLDKGVGLSALTALLARLFVEPIVSPQPAAAAGKEVPEGSAEDTQQLQPIGGGPSRTGTYRAVAIVAGALLIVWGVVTAITGNRAPERATVAETPGGTGTGVIAEPEPVTALDRAYRSLEGMIQALKDGNYVLAMVEAQGLMSQRDLAVATGFSVSSLDAEVTARLEVVAPDLPRRVVTRLSEMLGSLFPVLEEPSEPGGGSSVVLGTTGTQTGGTSGGTTTSGGGQTGGEETGGEETGGGGQTGPEETAPQPGDGRLWGQWHKEHKGPGGPPPWAKAWGHKK